MMGELVEMHREFIRYYGPDMDGLPKWMEGEKLNELLPVLQKTVTEDEGKDLISLMPLYRCVIKCLLNCASMVFLPAE